jgi:hypothetical protein
MYAAGRGGAGRGTVTGSGEGCTSGGGVRGCRVGVHDVSCGGCGRAGGGRGALYVQFQAAACCCCGEGWAGWLVRSCGRWRADGSGSLAQGACSASRKRRNIALHVTIRCSAARRRRGLPMAGNARDWLTALRVPWECVVAPAASCFVCYMWLVVSMLISYLCCCMGWCSLTLTR